MVTLFKRYKKIIEMLLFSFILLFAFILIFPGPLRKDKVIIIPQGSSARSIASMLKRESIIYSPNLVLVLAKFFGFEKKFIIGEFSIKKGINLVSLLYYLIDNKNLLYHKITFVEGITVKQVITLINNIGTLKDNITEVPEEGTLMPDTYFFTIYDTKDSIISTMKSAMDNYLNHLWNYRDRTLPYKNKNQALTLASLVEKEAASNDERRLIAGIFLNRLKNRMRLQSDPTVAYGLNKESANKLSRADLKLKTPFNTYIIHGLPPTPIANPSAKSLQAVFNPAKTNYLYFVANGRGGHVFSSNLKDHNKQVKKWRIIESNIRKRESHK